MGLRHWLALGAIAVAGGCSLGEGLGPDLSAYDLRPAPTAPAAWPRLVDVPTPPPPGTFSPEIPDPATGAATQARLAADAARLGAAAATLSAPVLSEADRARLRRGVTGG